MPTAATYRTITREQFLLRETRIVARMRLDGTADERVVNEVYSQNLLQYPTLSMVKNIAAVCLKRLDALSDDPATARELTALVANGSQEQAAQANLYAMMRGYRLVWEFMTGVIAAKYREFDDVLTRGDLNVFFAELQQAQPAVARWSDSTISKSKQVLTKSLTDAGLLTPMPDEPQGTFVLAPACLDPLLQRAMRANGDACALAAFNSAGEMV